MSELNSNLIENAQSEKLATWRNKLSALPALTPDRDCLAAVLAASAPPEKNRASQRWYVATALAASLAMLALWMNHAKLSSIGPVESHSVQIAVSDTQELAQLIAQSQQLEQRWQRVGERRASFSELSARQLAAMSVAQLDNEIANLPAIGHAPNELLGQQKTLWRERVAVLNAVEQGRYRPALYVID